MLPVTHSYDRKNYKGITKVILYTKCYNDIMSIIQTRRME